VITEELSDSCAIAVDLTKARFKDKATVVVARQQYKDVIRSIHLSGKVNVAEIILRYHKTNPYQSVEEVIGDLQLVLASAWNEFKLVNPSTDMGKITIEELIDELPQRH
jgi:hypothetical protein